LARSSTAPDAVTYDVGGSKLEDMEAEGEWRVERDDWVVGVAEQGPELVEELVPSIGGDDTAPRIHEPAVVDVG
jgi:hypothetical protein